jgi:hypothetical protein
VTDDPFATLGLSSGASVAEIDEARRRLARTHHPDRGGSTEQMARINDAHDAALAARSTAAAEAPRPPDRAPMPAPRPAMAARRVGPWLDRDEASFVVDVLPVEAFHVLTLAVAACGELLDDEPPYALLAHLYDPAECIVRCTLVPDAGSSTVGIAVAHLEGAPFPPPSADEVRDVLVAEINALGA